MTPPPFNLGPRLHSATVLTDKKLTCLLTWSYYNEIWSQIRWLILSMSRNPVPIKANKGSLSVPSTRSTATWDHGSHTDRLHIHLGYSMYAGGRIPGYVLWIHCMGASCKLLDVVRILTYVQLTRPTFFVLRRSYGLHLTAERNIFRLMSMFCCSGAVKDFTL